MVRSLHIASTGMQAQQINVEVISNNIANLNTTGFKRSRPEFQDLLYQEFRRVGSPSSDDDTIVPTGVQIGLGVKPAAIYRIHEQGNLVKTDNELDVAIQGQGFFNIQLPNGELAYTRSGVFQLSPDGTIVTADGYTVQPAMRVPETAVSVEISEKGQVSVAFDNQVATQQIGQFSMSNFINDAGLQSIGNNLYLQTTASGAPTVGVAGNPSYGTILQGFIESANVNAVTEITSLITAQRAFEMNSQVVQASDEMLRTVSNLR